MLASLVAAAGKRASTQDLWDVLCRRRQDFHNIDAHLQAKMKKQSYADLT